MLYLYNYVIYDNVLGYKLLASIQTISLTSFIYGNGKSKLSSVYL